MPGVPHIYGQDRAGFCGFLGNGCNNLYPAVKLSIL